MSRGRFSFTLMIDIFQWLTPLEPFRYFAHPANSITSKVVEFSRFSIHIFDLLDDIKIFN